MAEAEITPTEKAKAAFPTLRQSVEDAAFASADDLIDAGQTASEAGSIMAHILIRAAWKVAGCGRIADKVMPDPDKFRAAVEDALKSISFTDFNEQSK